MALLFIFGLIIFFLGIAFLYKWNQLRKDPEALKATRLLERKGYLASLKTRYLVGAILLIISGAASIIVSFILSTIFK